MRDIFRRLDSFLDRHHYESIIWLLAIAAVSWFYHHPDCVHDPVFCDIAFGLDCFIVALGITAFLWLCKLKRW